MGQCILVVDDEADVQRTVKFRLEQAGYEVTLASDGQEALDKLAAGLPDLVLLDLRLPVIDGSEVCRRIKSHDTWKVLPVILFTASAQFVRTESFRAFGADDFITKPFEWEDLSVKIKKLLGP